MGFFAKIIYFFITQFIIRAYYIHFILNQQEENLANITRFKKQSVLIIKNITVERSEF